MKILIVSDSHGRNTNLEKAIKRTAPIDLLIHLGDLEGTEHFLTMEAPCPVEMVSGNNDYFTSIDKEKIIEIGRYRILLTHGHRYKVYFGTERVKEWARENRADIVMFGHTHVPLIDRKGDIIALNPGSISQPRQEGHIPSYMVMELDRNGEAHFTINYLK